MAAGDDKLVRVRGGPNGFRLITLGAWKAEVKDRRGKTPRLKRLRDTRMEAKMRKRAKNKAKSKANDKANKRKR